MKIKLTKEMIKRCFRGTNNDKFSYYRDNDHIIIMPDRAFMMIIEPNDEWNDLIDGFEQAPDERLEGLRIRITSDVDILNPIKMHNDAFIRMGLYWKLFINDDSYLFDDKYLKYFIKKNDLSYDLFTSGKVFGLIIYEGSSDDGYSICGIVMGVRNG